MPGDDRDQWADALSAMANGAGEEEPVEASASDALSVEPESPAAPAPPPPPRKSAPARPATPVQPKAVAPRPATRPLAPGSDMPVPVTPAAPAPTLGKRPPAPGKPSVQSQAPAPPAPRRRPTAPVASQPHAEPETPYQEPLADPEALAHVEEGEDLMAIPAPHPDVFAHLPPAPVRRAPRQPFYAGLFFRQTLIPILLTTGVLFSGLGVAWFLISPDSVFKSPPMGVWLPITLVIMGLGLLAFGVMNVLHVKAQLQEQGPSDAAALR